MKIEHIVVVSLYLAAMCLLSPQPSAPQDLASPTTEKSSSPVRMATADTGKPQPAPNTATRSTGLRNHSLRFEVNLGQTDRRVKYLSRGPGYILFLRGTDAVLSLQGPTAALNHGTDTPPAGTELDRNEGRPRAMSPRGNPYALQSAGTLRITLLGTSQKATVNGLGLSPATSNYFIGNDPAKWRTDVPAYSSVRYRGIYQGTDLVYYGNQGQLESDFVLAPGAHPSHIRLRIDGAQHLTIDPQGDMAITVGTGQVQWRRPMIYQEVEGRKKEIEGGYRLEAKNDVGFWLGTYDETKPLVIDPVLVYSTYLGGSGDDNFYSLLIGGAFVGGVTTDSSGNVYVTGATVASDFPTRNGAYSSCASCGSLNPDVFVAKYSPTGTLVYSTYLGGSSANFPGGVNDTGGIAVDAVGDAYITGTTFSPDFPVTPGAFQRQCGTDGTCNGGAANSAFVTALNPSGSGLIYSTFLGGSCGEDGGDITVDPGRIAYVTGDSCSPEFPVTSGALRSPCIAGPGGCTHVFVTSFNPSGSALVYSALFGGSTSDFGNRIRIDASGAAYVIGSTNSPDFPVVPSGLPGSGPSGGAFVTTNGGLSWNSTNSGLPHNQVSAIAADPGAPGTVYAGTPLDGLFKSTNDGASWSPINNGGLPSLPFGINALAVSNGTLYATVGGVLFWSGDRGATWNQSMMIPGGGQAIAIAVDPTTIPQTVYVAKRQGQVQKSVDGGQTFSLATFFVPQNPPPTCAPQARSLIADSQNPLVLYAGTAACGIFKSADGAQTWSAVNNGFGNFFNQVGLEYGSPIPSLPLAIDATTNPSTVYAGVLWNIWKSSDGGANWSTLPVNSPTPANFGPGGFGTIQTIALDTSPSPSNPAIIYLGLRAAGARKSSDGGTTWSNISTGLNMALRAVVLSPSTPAVLYAGTALGNKGFVAKLDPSGASLRYSTYLGGNGNDILNALSVDPAGDAYIAGATTSTNFPTTSGAFQTTNNSNMNAFVTKLNPTGTGLIYSTYVGGSGVAWGAGLATDTSGIAYVDGFTLSTDFPALNPMFTTPTASTCGVPPLTRGCSHGILFQLNATGTALVSSTYIGGSGNKDDYPNDLALDATPSVSMTGATSSTDFPTLNAAQPTYAGGNSDAFVTKIDFSNSTQTLPGTNVVVQPSDSATGTTPAAVTFSNVTQPGNTTLGTSSTAPTAALPSNFGLGNPPTFYNISTSAVFTGSAQICISYAGVNYTDPAQLRLFHDTGSSWVDVTTSLNTSTETICGAVTSFSPFAILQALKQSPTITWNAPANITSGTALSGTQLDATAGVPGTFVYSPAAGTVLSPGTHTLSVTFTPSDTTHYNIATASVSITVNVNGNLSVSNGQNYAFTNARIGGNLVISGGTVVLNNSTVGGNLQMSAGRLTVASNSTISGNLQITGGTFSVGPANIGGTVQIQNLPASSAQNQICGTTVNGNLQLQNNRAAVSVGSSSCSGNTVGGNLQVTNSSAAAQVYHNAVSGNIQVQNDTAATAIFSNAVHGNLQCSGNTALLLTGGGNTAALKQGQCSSF